MDRRISLRFWQSNPVIEAENNNLNIQVHFDAKHHDNNNN